MAQKLTLRDINFSIEKELKIAPIKGFNQCEIPYQRILCPYERVTAKKGDILKICLEPENAIDNFALAVMNDK